MTFPNVVRVYCTFQDPDYESPWQSVAPRSSTGSGVYVGSHRILTGAHVVANATFVQVQRQDDPTKATARVVAISHDCDLALLEIDDRRFTRGLRAARIGGLPRLRETVQVVGFPIGGEELSITEGVVSRIEVQRYEHSQRHLLAVTVDAAINAGNSGGPVYARGAVVGIAFQSLPGAENIGEMVPAPILRRFLANVEAGATPLVPGLGLGIQALENEALRAHLGMRREHTGVLVTAVQYGGSAFGVLEAGDVLLELDGHPIADNGTIRYHGRHRCQLDALLGDHPCGATVGVKLLRARKVLRRTVTLAPAVWLVPRVEYDLRPMWFLYGGLVFQRLTAELLKNWGESWWDRAPKELLHLHHAGIRSEARQEVVVLTHVLADKVNVGYEAFVHEVVAEVDGVAPVDLPDFVRRVEAAEGAVAIRTSSGALLLLDVGEARAALPRILSRYRVPSDRSERLPAATVGASRAARRR